MSKPTLKVGLVQQPAWPDKQRSLDASEAGIRELAERGAELVLL
ncbi:MAG TPA: acyltransferase, partial [Modicisalibacter sp.]|nr:acyltransferase [Modicisalibacter sp.]